jgi:hypothetical protein
MRPPIEVRQRQFLAPEETSGRGPRFRQHIPELAPGCWTLNTS